MYLLFLFTFFVISCRKENQVSKVSPTQTEDIAALKSFLSEATGTKIDKVIFDDTKKEFVIDGDMMMSLKSASEHYAKAAATSSENPGGKTTQRRYTFLMNSTAARSVTIYADGSVPGAWQTAIDQSINNWNSTDCLFKLSRTGSSSGASIIFSVYTDAGTNVVAYSYLPNGSGNSGNGVSINLNANGLSAGQKQFAITHELGHSLGFLHTDQTDGILIPETPDASDPKSIMNSYVLEWAGYTYYDVLSYGIIYPNADNTKRFLRYYNGTATDHFYTLNSSELNGGAGGYTFERGAGYMYTSQVSGTVPLYRYYNADAKDHFYTTNYSTLGAGAGGYVLEWVAGYLFATQVSGTRPLYRYYSASAKDHFYTTDYGELGAGAGGYASEGIAGYVY
jgi:hypothetical protein